MIDVQQRPRAHDVGGQCIDPAAQRGDLAALHHRFRHVGDQVGCTLEIGRQQRMLHRFVHVAGRGKPVAGALVQHRDQVGLTGSETLAQQVIEQVVIAVPAALIVQRHHEEVVLFEPLQHRLHDTWRGLLVEQRAAKRRAQTIQDRGARQKVLHVGRLAVEDLLGEIVEDMTMAARKRVDEALRIGLALQRERRHLQARGPSLGTIVEQVHDGRTHGRHQGGGQQLRRLGRGEAQILLA